MNEHFFHKLNNGSGHQIICFPYLGGYLNSFNSLASSLDDDLELWAPNPPGHGTCSLKPKETLPALVDLYVHELKNILKKKCTFFGYSMGGVVAYFVAQRMLSSKDSDVEDIQLVLASCNPPNTFKNRKYSELVDDDLIDHLLSYNGIPEELIHDKSLIEYFMPVFRADFAVLESASKEAWTPLQISAHVLWGEDDPIVSLDSAANWTNYIRGPVHITPIEKGSHMFIHDQTELLANQLEQIVSNYSTNMS